MSKRIKELYSVVYNLHREHKSSNQRVTKKYIKELTQNS